MPVIEEQFHFIDFNCQLKWSQLFPHEEKNIKNFHRIFKKTMLYTCLLHCCRAFYLFILAAIIILALSILIAHYYNQQGH